MNDVYFVLTVVSTLFLGISLLVLVLFIVLIFKYRRLKKENFELKISIERMPYEMCLNCDKSK